MCCSVDHSGQEFGAEDTGGDGGVRGVCLFGDARGPLVEVRSGDRGGISTILHQSETIHLRATPCGPMAFRGVAGSALYAVRLQVGNLQMSKASPGERSTPRGHPR